MSLIYFWSKKKPINSFSSSLERYDFADIRSFVYLLMFSIEYLLRYELPNFVRTKRSSDDSSLELL